MFAKVKSPAQLLPKEHSLIGRLGARLRSLHCSARPPMGVRGWTVVWPRIGVIAALLVVAGCAAQQQEYAAERDAPDLSFKGPIPSVVLSSAQIKLVQAGIIEGLKDSGPPSFGKSYRAGLNADRAVVVCGFANGKRFVGMFAKAPGGASKFLPIGVSIDEQEEDAVKGYCRDDGIYLPQ
jgi:hypothetical protein